MKYIILLTNYFVRENNKCSLTRIDLTEHKSLHRLNPQTRTNYLCGEKWLNNVQNNIVKYLSPYIDN